MNWFRKLFQHKAHHVCSDKDIYVSQELYELFKKIAIREGQWRYRFPRWIKRQMAKRKGATQ